MASPPAIAAERRMGPHVRRDARPASRSAILEISNGYSRFSVSIRGPHRSDLPAISYYSGERRFRIITLKKRRQYPFLAYGPSKNQKVAEVPASRGEKTVKGSDLGSTSQPKSPEMERLADRRVLYKCCKAYDRRYRSATMLLSGGARRR